jgi:putative transcription factor
MSLEHQDWEPVILKKKHNKTFTNNDMRIGKFQVRTKKSESAQKMHQIDNETETFKVKKISTKVSKEIQKGRLAKKLSQKQLAQAVNVTSKVINEMESGKSLPNEAIKCKIARVLNIKI